jgi:hypothetical protein
MFKILPLIFCLATLTAQARVQPAEGRKLNYVMAGFMVDAVPGASKYKLQVAKGSYTDEQQFGKHIIIDTILAANRSITELPSFGTEYTWRISYLSNKKKVTGKTQLYHFATDTCEAIDTNFCKLKVISNKLGKSEMIITTDFRAVIYDLNGKPLWYLPKIKSLQRVAQIRDLKPTAQGTFTALYGFNAIEVDYNGNLLWKGPSDGKISGDTSEYYHHEFTRLSNGHYMVCGDEIWWAKPDSMPYGQKDMPKDIEEQAKKGQAYRRYVFGTLIEYDTARNIVWSWKSRGHFLNEESVPVANKMTYTGFTHLNSFYMNEKDSVIYMSYRDINRVVKIKYPSGQWLNSYGDKYANDSTEPGCEYFCGQHCIRTTAGGELYLYDNHSIRGNEHLLSYISIFTEPNTTDKTANVTKTWTFPCNIDSNASGGASTGGGVYMLADNSILCTTGAAGRLIIVNRDKQVLWNAVSVQKNGPTDKIWRNSAEYRVYPIVNKEDLARFIFH